MDITQWICARWERDSRYYEATLQQDLWGEWIVTLEWGSIGKRNGRRITRPCPSRDEGLMRLASIGQRRRKRGYALRQPMINAHDPGAIMPTLKQPAQDT